jgi:hypothetical protein
MPKCEMMAIGDSLFNGVRSLTINHHLAKWSAPKQVATALGIDFAVPDYPRHVVVDFENWVRKLPFIGGVPGEIEKTLTSGIEVQSPHWTSSII